MTLTLQNDMTKKLWMLFLLITVVAAGFFLKLNVGKKLTGDDLIIDSEVDLGQVNKDSKRVFKISLINPTPSNFTIARVYTSCGCTKVTLPENGTSQFTLKAGEVTYLSLEFDPSTMHQRGDEINHEAYILTTKPFEKEYKVKITGKII